MKGIIFTELLNLTEETFGYEVVDKIIRDAGLENDGAFTSIGTYDHSDLLKMVVALSQESGIQVTDLAKTFGKHLYRVFSVKHDDKFKGLNSAFELIENVENFIHVEVRKIYPDAQLPSFNYRRVSKDELVVEYRSERPFADVCEGLIEQCIESFGEEISIQREDVTTDGTAANFTLKKAAVLSHT